VTVAVEITVAGGVGDLLASMLAGVQVCERRPVGSVLVTTEEHILPLLDRLREADLEVVSIVAVATPDG